MELTMSKHINVHELIKRESIKMLFQPIVSTYYDQVSGVEALVRGIDPDSGEWISPFQLFEAAKSFAAAVMHPLESAEFWDCAHSAGLISSIAKLSS